MSQTSSPYEVAYFFNDSLFFKAINLSHHKFIL